MATQTRGTTPAFMQPKMTKKAMTKTMPKSKGGSKRGC